MSAQARIIVLGAGIIGLQTALTLLEAGLRVTIVAKHWPGDRELDYTSPWSGAQWRANLRREDVRLQNWDAATFKTWETYAARFPAKESGIELKPAVLYWDELDHDASDPESALWWSSLVPDFTVLPADSLPPGAGLSAGVSYKTFCIAPTKFLRHLLFRCLQMGAVPHVAEVRTVADVFNIDHPSISSAVGVVNCTGLCALTLAKDDTMFSTKGQTITVKGEADCIRTRIGGKWEAWVIPHPGTGTTLLGGCKLPHDWSTNVDDEITEWILARCQPLAPELLSAQGEFDVISVQIARRPSRKDGPRIELEWISGLSAQGRRFICHQYGHSHSGFENSVGSAHETLQLVLQAIRETQGVGMDVN